MRLLLAPLVAFSTLTVQKEPALKEPALVSGMGTLGCSELIQQLAPGQGYGQSKLSVAVFSWVQGYLSALNVVGIIQIGKFADLKSITEDEQWSYIVMFCERNPDGFVFHAVQEMRVTRLKVETAPPLSPTR
jgi:hypothetical protein